MRLFVDCDGTLSLFDLAHREDEVNLPLVRAIERWLDEEPDDSEIVVWSGGGRAYAEAIGRTVLGHLPHTTRSKYEAQPEEGDLAIDDMDLRVACEVVTPEEFVERWGV